MPIELRSAGEFGVRSDTVHAAIVQQHNPVRPFHGRKSRWQQNHGSVPENPVVGVVEQGFGVFVQWCDRFLDDQQSFFFNEFIFYFLGILFFIFLLRVK